MIIQCFTLNNNIVEINLSNLKMGNAGVLLLCDFIVTLQLYMNQSDTYTCFLQY